MVRTLHLDDIICGRHQLIVRWSLDELHFGSTLWYDVDLLELAARHQDQWRRITFHIALFEMSRGVSLGATELDLGEWADLYTEQLDALWRRVIHGVWAQWRYQHDRPDQPVPVPRAAPVPDSSRPMERGAGATGMLAFCGGGKDSLIVLDLLERAGQEHGVFVYTSSSYGRSDMQRQLIDRLLTATAVERVHHATLLDDLSQSPVMELHPELGTNELTAAETPVSLMAALPVVLAGGYRHIVLGHERSANAGNLIWERTGEEINHQWGKSREAEELLNGYIQAHLIADLRYFSLLQPVHDPLIFAALARRLDAVALTHSCNVHKPWCGRCAKCAYVWLGYKAWLPWEVVDPIFASRNLAHDPANLEFFRQMLGLADHTPFECVGQVEEARLFMAMCRSRGLTGMAVDLFEREVVATGWQPHPGDLMRAHAAPFGGPPELLAHVMGEMRDVAAWAWQHLEATLSQAPDEAVVRMPQRLGSAER